MNLNRLSASLILTYSAFLVACDENSAPQHQIKSPPPTPHTTPYHGQGRLIFTNADATRPLAYTYDLEDKKIINTYALKGKVSNIYSSPSYRYAVILDRENDTVQFIDGGLFSKNQENNVQAPLLLNYQLTGKKPTHYRSFDGQATIFYDGDEQTPSRFDLLTDQFIENRQIISQNLPSKHHGVAEPRGEYIFSTYTDKDWTETLPKFVKNYQLHGDHFHEAQQFTTPCDGLHGAASGKSHAVFGCIDGVLTIAQNGQKASEQKINLDQRIGTLIGHKNLVQVLGFSSSGEAFVIDPVQRNARTLNWKVSDKKELDLTTVKRIAAVFNTDGKYFLILDSQGTLHTFNTLSWTPVSSIKLIKGNDEQIAQSKLAVNFNTGTLYLNELSTQSIIEFDVIKQTIVQRIQLNDSPTHLAWVGIVKS